MSCLPPASPRPRPPGGLRFPRACARARVFPPRPRGGARETRGRAPGLRGIPAPLSSSGSAAAVTGEARGGRGGRGGAEARREGRGRARPVRRPEGKKRPHALRALATPEGSADPAVQSACHLAPSNRGSSKGTLGTFVGEWLPPPFCLVFKFLVSTFCLVFKFLVSFHFFPFFLLMLGFHLGPTSLTIRSLVGDDVDFS